VETSNVADVLDEMGLYHQGLHPSFGQHPSSTEKLAGWAFTIRGQMSPYELGHGDIEKMNACAGLSAGEISCWSGGGVGVCFFGELIAVGMQERGCVGALVDGGVRDVAWLNKHRFPVFARYTTPVQSIGRWKVNASQVPIGLPGATTDFVRVNPGDFILGDSDGVVVVPHDLTEVVLDKAEELGHREVEIRAALGAGMSLSEALAKYGHV
jgi:regulator of RNase E activity RraA